MASSSKIELNSDEIDVVKTLYTNSYLRTLQCAENDDSSGAAEELRILLHQISFQNVPESSKESVKNELILEYSKIIDNEDQPGLLPVIHDEYDNGQKQISATFTARKLVNEFKDHFNKYYSKIVPDECNTISVNDRNVATVQTNNHFSRNKRPIGSNLIQSEIRFNKNPKLSNDANITSKNSFQIASRGLSKPNSTTKHFNKNQNVADISSRGAVSSKASTPGFMSARTMYKNPLKKESSNDINENPQSESLNECDLQKHESLKNFDKKITSIILNEIMDFSPNIKWSDIAGLEFVKKTVQEIVIWPLLRPDIFTGLRAPPRGILLFGPPGTGKTLIGKCIATESNSTFFCISASSLASKWVGESEQLVRALFAIARLQQPSVIFIDEIDSLLSQRSDKDQDFTRKLKTEFLVQFDGAKTDTEERVLVVGATNRPHELDEAARRRFVKRLFVPLPNHSARRQIIEKLLKSHKHCLTEENLTEICERTEGYSGSDVAHLCKEAAMGPIRCIGPESIKTVSLDQVRSISIDDFTNAMKQVRASVVQDDLNYYLEWNKKFGSFGV